MPKLQPEDRRDYRDRLRIARYAALADAEGFAEICFALEELGIHVTGKVSGLGKYSEAIGSYVSPQMTELAEAHPGYLSRFSVVFEIVRNARNDAMHSGAYARHVTQRAIELCILLEEGLMPNLNMLDSTVGDYMVKDAISITQTQPVARARQLMLTYSFSNLPVELDGKWYLLTEIALARFLAKARSADDRFKLLGKSVAEAFSEEPSLLRDVSTATVTVERSIRDLLQLDGKLDQMLWLVLHNNKLVGVISPSELM